MSKIKILDITPRVYEFYRKKTKGNKNISLDQARRKLTRNTMLAKKVPPRDQTDIEKGNTLYSYGKLSILVRDNCIIHMANHRKNKMCEDWHLDEEKFFQLTIELGIS